MAPFSGSSGASVEAAPALRPPPLPVLVLSTALSSLGLHMVVPALPEIAAAFDIAPGDVGYIVAVYFIGLSAAQLIVGPLSDRFGRRPVLLGGVALFILMSIVCTATQSALWLLLARSVQAFGACAGMVLGRTIIRDCYPRDRAASGMGYLSVALASGSMMAPAVGAFIITFAGWRGVFVMLALLGLVSLVSSTLYQPETIRTKIERLDLFVMMRSYLWLMRSRIFVMHTAAVSLQLAAWFSFVTVLPGALVTVYHLPATAYGLWVFLPMSGYIIGNGTVGRLSMRVGGPRLIRIGASIAALGAALMAAGALGLIPGPIAFFLPMAIIVIGNGIISPNANVAAISVNPAIMGAASGLLGFFIWTTSAVLSALVSYAGSANLGFLATVVITANAITILCLLCAPKGG
jgi:MFS transporter, DHA1 family, multidrug resistance protein